MAVLEYRLVVESGCYPLDDLMDFSTFRLVDLKID